jgi:phage tail sheath protein FI
MPVTLTYPGVYIEEIPSGVRTIVGVATSITAFIGRALRGPVDEPVVIDNFGAFEREFGGLWVGNSLGYAVRDYFLNGGGQAIIVRIYRKSAADKPGIATLTAGNMKLAARSPGAWGSALRAEVLAVDADVAQAAADDLGVPKEDLFNLRITDGATGTEELFRNITVKTSRRRVDQVLRESSTLVTWDGEFPTGANVPTVSLGQDAVSGTEAALTAARKKQLEADDKRAAADKKVTAAQKVLDAANAETPKNQPKIDAAQQALDGANTDAGSAKTDAEGAKTAADTAASAHTAALDKQDGSNGDPLQQDDFLPTNGQTDKKGLFALEHADLFNLLCIPPYKGDDVDADLITAAAGYCEGRRAMLLVDPPSAWTTPAGAISGRAGVGTASKNAALFFPRLIERDPLRENRQAVFAPCGAVAGVMARTDAQRGVWKAPAGTAATLSGVVDLSVPMTNNENGRLNPLGINCLRSMPVVGPTVWGARTLQGHDALASEWKYIPIRRLALYIEESLFRGTQWVVFEPNDEPLWSQIRLNVGAFMHDLFRQGAFQGQTPNDAYLVKVDKETTTQSDINKGIVNIVVGFAPLKPAEFVVLKIKQLAGRIET